MKCTTMFLVEARRGRSRWEVSDPKLPIYDRASADELLRLWTNPEISYRLVEYRIEKVAEHEWIKQ